MGNRMDAAPTLEMLALGVRKAAQVADVCPRVITYHVANGDLPSKKIGGRRLILMRDLRNFLAHDQPPATRNVKKKLRA